MTLSKIPKFRRFVLQNFPFIEQDFDALTDYELLCKVVEYLNNVIDSQNEVTAEFEALSQAFEQLNSYVTNYFDNLDVQEEINNKLDEMAEDGQLTELIAQFLSLNAVMSFPNIASMKLAQNLVNGSTVETYGFYAVNDGGGAKYLIRTITNDDTIDEKTIIAVYDDYLVAELIKEDVMSVKQFGAKGDGTTDDTSSIQTALNYNHNIFVPNGTFMVNAITHINLNSNNKLTLDNAGIIKAIANNEDNYAVLNIEDVDNVTISGGTIQGDKTTHTGETGEWGICVSISDGSSNIVIENVRIIDGWGDGLYINNAINVTTNNLIIDNCRRNGISVISANNYHSLNDTITNISGVDPQFGVDIEPNENTDILKNINFENLSTASCNKGSFCISLQNLDNTSAPIAIKINNYSDNSSPVGLKLIKDDGVEGELVINDASLMGNINNGVQFRNWQYNEKFYTKIVGLNIRRTSVESNANTNSAIYMLGTTKSGNIVLENLNIEQTGVGNNAYDIYLASQNDNVAIVNPIHKTSVYHVGNYSTNFHISDVNEVLKLESPTASGTIGTYDIRSLSVRNGNSPTDTTATFDANTPVGYKCVFTNINSGTGLYQIQLPASTYCRQFSTSAAPLIKLASGATLTLQRLNATEFIVLSASGTITV